MMWKCLIIDDDPIALMIVKKYADLIEQLEVVALCNNAFEALAIMKIKKIALLFLDIEMPDLSGISFIKTLQPPPKVIFISSYTEYAAEAFNLGAADYLLKPLSLERFLTAVNKVIGTDVPEDEDHYLSTSGGHLFLRTNGKMVKVFFEDILYVESTKAYIRIYRWHDTPLLVKQSLASIEDMLPPDLFMRIHRSYIVSINRVTAFTNHDVEIDKVEIPIGRQYSGKMKSSALVC
jgi:DNA-binding LytR/AlgR family response regulator